MRSPVASEGRPPSEAVFAALDDPMCRRIVSALEEPLSAQELSEAADVPLSTTYKKLDRLSEADLVVEATELHPGGHHRSRYAVAFERLVVALDDRRRFAITMDDRIGDAERQLMGIWSELRRET